MADEREKIYITERVPTDEEAFKKVHNPDFACPDCFRVIYWYHREKTGEGLSSEEINEIRQRLSEMGREGKFIIQKNFGGPGRKRDGETKEEWQSKKLSGLRKIGVVEV